MWDRQTQLIFLGLLTLFVLWALLTLRPYLSRRGRYSRAPYGRTPGTPPAAAIPNRTARAEEQPSPNAPPAEQPIVEEPSRPPKRA